MHLIYLWSYWLDLVFILILVHFRK